MAVATSDWAELFGLENNNRNMRIMMRLELKPSGLKDSIG